MILLDWQIKDMGEKLFDPFVVTQINPASYDLTWSGSFRRPCHWAYDNNGERWFGTVTNDRVSLNQGEFLLLDTNEVIDLPPNMAAQLLLKSSLARDGLNHVLAGWVDPGFYGTLTMEVTNLHPMPLTLHAGQRLAQLVLYALDARVDKPYEAVGRYYGQMEPTPARARGNV